MLETLSPVEFDFKLGEVIRNEDHGYPDISNNTTSGYTSPVLAIRSNNNTVMNSQIANKSFEIRT